MPKTASDATVANRPRASTTPTRLADQPRVIKISLRKRRVDPRVVQAIDHVAPGEALTVMLKLDPKASVFARYSASNKPGNARLKAFEKELAEIVEHAAQSSGRTAEVLKSLPNIGVAKIRVQAGDLPTLLEDQKIVGVQLSSS